VPEHRFIDDDDGGEAAPEVRRVQPYQATKTYRCPGCDHPIPPGTGHVVVIPAQVEGRRHWHRACWERETRRTRR